MVPAIKAQDRDPGPETTMLNQWDAEQEPALPEATPLERSEDPSPQIPKQPGHPPVYSCAAGPLGTWLDP